MLYRIVDSTGQFIGDFINKEDAYNMCELLNSMHEDETFEVIILE